MSTKHFPSKMRYFHELPPEERKRIFESGITVQQLMDNYLQPKWCGYPQALSGKMGCWSLVDPDTKVSEEYCKDCECKLPS